MMAATMPGARGLAAMEAAFTTEAAVNVGVCACDEGNQRQKEIAIPINVVRNVYSISDETISKSNF